MPGTSVLIRTSSPPSSQPAATSPWFVVGTSEKGPVTPVLITSLSQFVSTFGTRQTYSVLYDAVEAFFQDGGSACYVSRVVGPTPVLATRNLLDASSGICLVAKAKSYGTWGNGLKVGVVAGDAGGEFKIKVTDSADVQLELSSSLVAVADAVTWALTSDYIRLTLGASSLDPAVAAPAALSTGTDDRDNAVDAHWATALNKFGRDLGPGQVSMTGRTTSVAHIAVLAHAKANNRTAYNDAPDVGDSGAATLLASAAAVRAGSSDGRYGGLFGPWGTAPGVTSGTTRDIPPSATEAGLTSRNDSAGLPLGQPAAGKNGVSRWLLGVKAKFTEAERESLNTAGVSVAIEKNGAVRMYGFRTLANPVTEPDLVQLGQARTIMAALAAADVIAEDYVETLIDGEGKKLAQYGGELKKPLSELWDEGSLYGATAEEAFSVDVGPQVNTTETIAAGEVHAVLGLKTSPTAEMVYVELVKTPITEALS